MILGYQYLETCKMNSIETSNFKISSRNKTTFPVKHAMILLDRIYWVAYYLVSNGRDVWARN